MNKSFFTKISIIIICTYSNNFILFNINKIFTDIKIKNEIKNFEHFFKFCNSKIKISKNFKKMKNPKVSIISPLHNRGRFLIRFLKNIQNQNFDDIEIILVDDKSYDNGVNILEEYRRKDKRIKIIKNKKNKGTFIARNIGVLYSKAKYIILPDPDDIISKDIISICLFYAEKYKIEIIRYHSYSGNKKDIIFSNKIESRPIYQPELQTYLYYGNNELEKIDYYINNKMINKKLFIKALNSLNNFYLNIYMTFIEDQLMIFILYKTAKSFYYIKKFGYYYKRNTLSICKNIFKLSQVKMKCFFIYLKLVYEYTKNIKYEKDIVNYLFTIMKGINIEREISSSPFNNDFYFYYDIINMLLKSKYTSSENSILLYKLKNIIQIKNKTFVNSIKKTHFK